jgi:hypothetical protein
MDAKNNPEIIIVSAFDRTIEAEVADILVLRSINASTLSSHRPLRATPFGYSTANSRESPRPQDLQMPIASEFE